MGATIFTEKQQLILMNNPYVLRATPQRLTMTYEFKKLFLEEDQKPGMTARKIFERYGIGEDLISRSRINSIAKRIRREAASEEGLKPDKGPTREEQLALFEQRKLEKGRASDIKVLQKEIVELRQEVEFLKKISSLYSTTLGSQNSQNTTAGDDTS